MLIHENDPNISLNNLHRHINYILDEFEPFKKLSKEELKLKSKPWINNLILIEINKRDMLLRKYSKMKHRDNETAKSIYDEYKIIRNKVTKLKRDGRVEYYPRFFDENKRKSSAIWKGIRSIVNINSTTRKDIKLLDEVKMCVIQIKLLSYLTSILLRLEIILIRRFQDLLNISRNL